MELELILDYVVLVEDSLKSIMKYLDTLKVQDYRGSDFHIVPQGGCVYYYKQNETISSYTDVGYIDSLYGSNIDIANIKSNILVLGLDIGCIPHWLSNLCPLSNIDVVDGNKELIDCIKSMGYLHKKINIFHNDIFSFIPNSKYDIIITDIWWEIDNQTLSDIQTLREHYNPYLKLNGKFYTPFIEPYSYEKL